MTGDRQAVVQRVVAYVTRRDGDLLVFDAPDRDGLQVPTGTVEDGETPREALFRAVAGESGLAALGSTRHLVTDVRERTRDPRRLDARHFFRTRAHCPRDSWTHAVTGDGAASGAEVTYRWVDRTTDRAFALDLDDYLALLE